jgi:hypothetical protein
MDTIDNDNQEFLESSDAIFEKLMCRDESLDGGDKVNDDLSHYFSSGNRPIIHTQGNHVRKPRGLSFDDLAATPESDAQSVRSGSMKGKRDKIEASQAPLEPEKSEYHNNVYWK